MAQPWPWPKKRQEVTRQTSGQTEMSQMEVFSSEPRCWRSLFARKRCHTMWAPPVIRWFINPINYSYRYHKP